MKRALLSVAASISCLMLSSTALSAQDGPSQYEIPFSFNAEGVDMPAGHYAVSAMSLSVGSLRGPSGSILFIRQPQLAGKPGRAHLTFEKYGDAYFLHEVWSESGHGSSVRESSRERKLQSDQQARIKAQTVVYMASR